MDLKTQRLLDRIKRDLLENLEENLVGIYLHGSLALGGYNPAVSDVDFIVVVKEALSKEQKMWLVADFEEHWMDDAPEKGLELHVMVLSAAQHYRYPPQFDFHFTNNLLAQYHQNPTQLIQMMQGEDVDLVAHLAVLQQAGKTLYGAAVQDVFAPVPAEDYWKSIVWDIQDAEQLVMAQPMYVILNLCRALAYKETHQLLSKEAGASWALQQLADEWMPLVSQALSAYRQQGKLAYTEDMLAWTHYMLKRMELTQ
ncbi:aminoglycoside adenylyltransferase domain-containing protein [Fundicoccus culcitae]|uniref:Spectinomycin 9-adenylyltransferase n=1 Tax=Fundicoccus culcitae TaxID=2969821 RepID=A0ABY5P362_9LACT|nr:aminoglycoside adenylyltransferase domain-containing protein [Fundicoccus culcitae]UUX33176.1 DUF4111 domain-containing protein [Fundicoccus culcitae]